MGLLGILKTLLCCCWMKDPPDKTPDTTFKTTDSPTPNETVPPIMTTKYENIITYNDKEILASAARKKGLTSFFQLTRDPRFFRRRHQQGTVLMYNFIKKMEEKKYDSFCQNICAKLRMNYFIKGNKIIVKYTYTELKIFHLRERKLYKEDFLFRVWGIEKTYHETENFTRYKFNFPNCMTDVSILKNPEIKLWCLLRFLIEEFRPKFRIYVPAGEILKENLLPAITPGDVEAVITKVVIKELVCSNLARRKPEWDWKRDAAKKLEQLEIKTQSAFGKLYRDRLKSGLTDFATSVSLGARTNEEDS